MDGGDVTLGGRNFVGRTQRSQRRGRGRPARLGIPEPDPWALPRALRMFITESGMTQGELARKSGLYQSQISRFMAGKHDLCLEAAGRVATALGLRLVKESEEVPSARYE